MGVTSAACSTSSLGLPLPQCAVRASAARARGRLTSARTPRSTLPSASAARPSAVGARRSSAFGARVQVLGRARDVGRVRPRAVTLEDAGGSIGMDGRAADHRADRAAEAFSNQGLDELASVVLNFQLGFTEKMLKVCKVFERTPAQSATRFAEVLGVWTKIYGVWRWEGSTGKPEELRKRGELLRNGIAQLGPVFVKMAQTLSTRPDIIGEEAANSLLVLQDQMGPFDTATAMEIIREDLQWAGPVVMDDSYDESSDAPPPLFRKLTPEPIAAASIGQVYKGELMDGRTVAVKVQRPGMVKKIALDMYIIRQLLDWLEKSGFNGSEDLPIIVDEVGAAIFYELDYRKEAQNVDDFTESLKMLEFVKCPTSIWEYTSRRVLVQEWINGRPMKALSLEEQREMVQMGVTCSATQLLRTGLVHADPHEGNMMYTDDGRLGLLDFGLVCRVDNEKQEAMAACILNILNANWDGVVDDLRVIGILPEQASAWTNSAGERIKFEAGVEGEWVDLSDEDFKREFGEALRNSESGDAKSNFTELVVDLTELAGKYRFCLPPYMVFIIRSITTLDFCAVRTNCNMYEVAAPVAIWRALTPRTASGREALSKALLTKTGEIDWERLQALSDNGSKADQFTEAADTEGVNAGDAKDPMIKLLNDLIVSPEGAALRRVAFQASPKALLPPASMRAAILKGAQKVFKNSVRSFSLWNLMRLAVEGLKRRLDQSKDKCELIEDANGRFACQEALARRRQTVITLLLRNKLASPAGLITSVKLLGLMVWVVGSVMTTSLLETVRFLLFDSVRLAFKQLTGKGKQP